MYYKYTQKKYEAPRRRTARQTNKSMKLGISTACYYPDETESAVSRLAAAGIDTVEIFFNTFSELDPTFIAQLKKTLGEIEVVSIHPFTSGFEPFLFFTGYDRRYQDGIELYKRYYQACAALGARYLVFHGDRRESDFAQELYFERFAQLDSIARTFGVQLLQENVARCRSNSPAFLRAMREYLHQEVGFVLDTKQCLRSGTTAFEVLETMGGVCPTHSHQRQHPAVRLPSARQRGFCVRPIGSKARGNRL